jgi:alpha-ketoglutarate-dependent 2,4-dichlorophenoxyacetate dioxygenase
MDVVSLGPGFAAELRGITLTDVVSDDAAYAAARAAFEEHSVLVFRGQEVTDELQLPFSRRFGPPEVTKVGSQGTGTHFVILSTIGPDRKSGPARSPGRLAQQGKPALAYRLILQAVPALTSILSARIIPARGGETEFVSTRLAFERLDPALREKLENSFAWHDYAHSRSQITADLASPEERAAFAAAVLAHGVEESPPTVVARSIWPRTPTPSRAWSRQAGKKLIAELMAAATAPGTSYLHQWRGGDVVMWDNRATMHRGRPWPAHEARLMIRTTISATEADGVGSMRCRHLRQRNSCLLIPLVCQRQQA